MVRRCDASKSEGDPPGESIDGQECGSESEQVSLGDASYSRSMLVGGSLGISDGVAMVTLTGTDIPADTTLRVAVVSFEVNIMLATATLAPDSTGKVSWTSSHQTTRRMKAGPGPSVIGSCGSQNTRGERQ